MSKNKKSKKIDGSEDEIPAEANDDLMEPTAGGEEAPSVNTGDSQNPESSTTEEPSNAPSEDEALDNILEDVRRSLIEDETTESQKQQSKWWRRIGLGTSKRTPPAEEPKVVEEIDLPAVNTSGVEEEIDDLKHELESEEYLDQIDELIDLLDDDAVQSDAAAPVVQEIPAEPEKPVDLEELKKQAFQPRTTPDSAETLSEVRSIALQGDEEVFVEVESKPADPLDERLKAMENALKPYRRYVYFAIAFLGIVMAGIALTIIYSIYQRSRPAPAAAEVSNLPFPTSVSLPGGWTFQLGKGSLTDGRWEPGGAEWLTGTEVCRWVSLPWSRQLEAVVRTLNEDDTITLVMSNNDSLTYKVDDIRQMSPEEMQGLDSNSPCLLIMLAEPGAATRWVLTALPQ